MTISKRLFVMPMIGEGTRENPIRGKYVREDGVLQTGAITRGEDRIALVMLEAEQSVLDAVAAKPDVEAVTVIEARSIAVEYLNKQTGRQESWAGKPIFLGGLKI